MIIFFRSLIINVILGSENIKLLTKATVRQVFKCPSELVIDDSGTHYRWNHSDFYMAVEDIL